MRIAWATALVVILGTLAAQRGSAAVPDPGGPSVEQWEYAELSATTRRVAAQGVAGIAPAVLAEMRISWSTASGEIEATGWDELAGKLGAEGAKAGAPTTVQRLRAFNRLGRDGWELTAHVKTSTSAPETWTFKRRVVK